MTSRQAPSSQPLRHTTASILRTTLSVAVKACCLSYSLSFLLFIVAGAAACEGETAGGSWCAAVPAVVDVQSQGQFVPAVQAVCPEHATVACDMVRHSDWCCPSGHTCGLTAANAVGCCPHGTTCGNAHEPVQVAVTSAAAVAVAPVVVADDGQYNEHHNPDPAVAVAPVVVADDGKYNEHHPNPDPAAIVVAPETVVAAVPTTLFTKAAIITDTVFTPIETIVPAAVVGAGEYCSTIIADGPGLPTTIPGVCGTVLVTNEGPWSVMKSGGLWVRDWHIWVGGVVWIVLGILL